MWIDYASCVFVTSLTQESRRFYRLRSPLIHTRAPDRSSYLGMLILHWWVSNCRKWIGLPVIFEEPFRLKFRPLFNVMYCWHFLSLSFFIDLITQYIFKWISWRSLVGPFSSIIFETVLRFLSSLLRESSDGFYLLEKHYAPVQGDGFITQTLLRFIFFTLSSRPSPNYLLQA